MFKLSAHQRQVSFCHLSKVKSCCDITSEGVARSETYYKVSVSCSSVSCSLYAFTVVLINADMIHLNKAVHVKEQTKYRFETTMTEEMMADENSDHHIS